MNLTGPFHRYFGSIQIVNGHQDLQLTRVVGCDELPSFWKEPYLRFVALTQANFMYCLAFVHLNGLAVYTLTVRNCMHQGHVGFDTFVSSLRSIVLLESIYSYYLNGYQEGYS